MAAEKTDRQESPTMLVLEPEGSVRVGAEPRLTLTVGTDVATIERRWGGFLVTALPGKGKALSHNKTTLYIPDGVVRCAGW